MQVKGMEQYAIEIAEWALRVAISAAAIYEQTEIYPSIEFRVQDGDLVADLLFPVTTISGDTEDAKPDTEIVALIEDGGFKLIQYEVDIDEGVAYYLIGTDN